MGFKFEAGGWVIEEKADIVPIQKPLINPKKDEEINSNSDISGVATNDSSTKSKKPEKKDVVATTGLS